MHKHIIYFILQKEYALMQRIRFTGIFVNIFCHVLHNKVCMDKAMKLAQNQTNIDFKTK